MVAVGPPTGRLFVGCGIPWPEFGDGGLIVLEVVPCAKAVPVRLPARSAAMNRE